MYLPAYGLTCLATDLSAWLPKYLLAYTCPQGCTLVRKYVGM